MNALIDQVLNTIMHSAIWRAAWRLPTTTLIIIAVVVFIIIAIRRKRRKRPTSKRYRTRGKYFK